MKNNEDFFTNNILEEILCNIENHVFEDIKFLCDLYNYKRKIHDIVTGDKTEHYLFDFKNAYENGFNKVKKFSKKYGSNGQMPLIEYDVVLRQYNIPKKKNNLKLTPFRQLLYLMLKWVKNTWINENERGTELLSYPSDIENKISDNRKYNIEYYSVRDS
ncbi:PIR Superfamily Protein [Plasmodium ovale curtisi]|uniref:PIR Superfamily Protein n=1 Tax=Plasmodium ovale curtisi TaxID=864141 RepID=A0A1A8WK21_PLAOA|nr:PIR Superfamily Protein [Plasmodium ovale curtisi]